MRDIQSRLRTSIKLDCVNGDGLERSVFVRQASDAADRIDQLERENAILASEVNRLNIAMCASQSDAAAKAE